MGEKPKTLQTKEDGGGGTGQVKQLGKVGSHILPLGECKVTVCKVTVYSAIILFIIHQK